MTLESILLPNTVENTSLTSVTDDKKRDLQDDQTNVDFKMVTFSLSEKDYAIDITNVKEIVKASNFTFVPNVLPFVVGVYNLRGEIIPIIDMKLFFNINSVTDKTKKDLPPKVEPKESEKPSDKGETKDGEKISTPQSKRSALKSLVIITLEDQTFGIIVDNINKVVGVQKKTIRPPHPLFSDVNIKYISGVVESGKRLYILLDIERIFSKTSSDNALHQKEKVANISAKAIVDTSTMSQHQGNAREASSSGGGEKQSAGTDEESHPAASEQVSAQNVTPAPEVQVSTPTKNGSSLLGSLEEKIRRATQKPVKNDVDDEDDEGIEANAGSVASAISGANEASKENTASSMGAVAGASGANNAGTKGITSAANTVGAENVASAKNMVGATSVANEINKASPISTASVVNDAQTTQSSLSVASANNEYIDADSDPDYPAVKSALKEQANFCVTSINESWIKDRFGNWKTSRGGVGKITSESDAREYLKDFWSRDTGTWWSEEYAAAVEKVLPPINAMQVLVWNPGCADGRESFCLSCVLHKHYPSTKIKVYAQDSDLLAISNAPMVEVPDELATGWLAPFLSKTAKGKYTFSKEIKDSIMFEYHDCLHTNITPMCDVIFSRDLLSTFEENDVETVVADFSEKLRNSGILFVGENEDLSGMMSFIEKTIGDVTIYKKQ